MTANMTPLYLDIWSKPWPEVVAGLSGLASLSDYLAQPIDAGPPEAPGTRIPLSIPAMQRGAQRAASVRALKLCV